jgi:hypothetical protein
MVHRIGDIVSVINTGEKKLVLDYRDEILYTPNPCLSKEAQYKIRTVYQLAGKKKWFTGDDISYSIPKR